MENGSFDMLAASLRADMSDLNTFVEVLAGKVEDALPGRVTIERRGGGLFSREKKVHRIEINLDNNRYALLADRGRIQARRSNAVRGIVLKTEELSLDSWIDLLSRDLAAEAEQSESARVALERLLGI
jgi:hypothetical protein